jgi:hypothetical protein
MTKKQILAYCMKNKTKSAEVPADLQAWFDGLLMHRLPNWFFDIQISYEGQVTRDNWEADKWIFQLQGCAFDYYTGLGLRDKEETDYHLESPYDTTCGRGIRKPSVYDLFYALCLDALLGDDTFEHFCANCGYDEDSRRAYATWQACQETAKQLERLGVDYHALSNYFSDIGF